MYLVTINFKTKNMHYFIFRTLLFSMFLLTSIAVHAVNDNIIHKNNFAYRRTAKKSHLRVIKGTEDTMNRYPYVVALGVPVELLDIDEEMKRLVGTMLYPEFLPTCSGSLVSEKWVLTASHCISEFEGRTLPTRIRYGHMTVAPNDTRATFSEVRKAVLHPSYRDYPNGLINDIALLLVNKVHLNVYGRVSAVDYRTLIGLPVVYAGYGRINGSEDTPLSRQHKSLLYGEAAVVPCSKLLLAQPMICSVRKCTKRGQMPYYGDSGGPLLHASRIVGVCTGAEPTDVYTIGEARTSFLYTAASPYLDWIFTAMSKAP